MKHSAASGAGFSHTSRQLTGTAKPVGTQKLVAELSMNADGYMHVAHNQRDAGEAVGTLGADDETRRRNIHTDHSHLSQGKAKIGLAYYHLKSKVSKDCQTETRIHLRSHQT